MGGNAVSGQARRAEASRPVQLFGRIGMAGYGVVHLLVAWLAVQITFGGGSGQADQTGAITTIAAQPFGSVLLWALAVILIAFGVWQLLAAAVGFRWIADHRKRQLKRLGVAGRGVAVLALASASISLVAKGGGGSGDASEQDFTAKLLVLPAGPFLVILVALAVLAAAAVIAYRGYAKKFLEDLDTTKLSPEVRRVVRLLGTVGYIAKGIAYGVIGVLLGVAALNSDPNRAGGLDKALRTLAAQPMGVVLLVAVAIGFAAFGVYCFGDARCRRM